MPITNEEYWKSGRAAAGAVCVVAARDASEGTLVALTVSSFVTLSFEPPLVMFAIQHNASSYSAMVESKAFGVSLLNATQSDVAKQFASKGRQKTHGAAFDVGRLLSVPLVPEALAQMECATNQVIGSGDHAIVVGLVEAARTAVGQPLLYFSRQFGTFTPLCRAPQCLVNSVGKA